MPPINISFDLIGAVILAGTTLVLLYDRFSLIKQHDKIINNLQDTMTQLSKEVNTLALSMTELSAEFHTYKELHIIKK